MGARRRSNERMKAPFEGVAAATSTKNADRIFCVCASYRAFSP
jgi:hypothetical protein